MSSNENQYPNGSTTILQHEVQQYGGLITASNVLGDEAAAAIERRTTIQQKQWTCQMNHFATCGNSGASPFYSLGAEPVRNLTDGKPLVDPQGTMISVERYLATKPLRSDLSSRPGPGNQKLTYISGEAVGRTLNEAFGFDGWCLEVKSTNREECIKDDKGRWNVAYTATVRLIIRKSGAYKEDVGAGCSKDKDMGQAIGNALKSSVTDAMKRAARHFGEKLGNSLYSGTFNMMKAPVTLEEALTRLETETESSHRKKKALPSSKAEKRIDCDTVTAIDALPNSKIGGGSSSRPALITNDQSVVHHVSKVILPVGKGSETQNQNSALLPSNIINPYQANISNTAASVKAAEVILTTHTPAVNNTDCTGKELKPSNSTNYNSDEHAHHLRYNATMNASEPSVNSIPNAATSNPSNTILSLPSANSCTIQGLQTSSATNSYGGQLQGVSSASGAATVIGTSLQQNQPSTSVIARYKQQQQDMETLQAAGTTDTFFLCTAGIRGQAYSGSNLLEDWKNDPPLPADTNSFHPRSSACSKPTAMADVTNHLRYIDESYKGDAKRNLPDQNGHLEQPKRMALNNPYAARNRTSL